MFGFSVRSNQNHKIFTIHDFKFIFLRFFAQHCKLSFGVWFRSVSFLSVQSSGVRRKAFTLQISALFSEDRLTAVVDYIVTVIVAIVFAAAVDRSRFLFGFSIISVQ